MQCVKAAYNFIFYQTARQLAAKPSVGTKCRVEGELPGDISLDSRVVALPVAEKLIVERTRPLLIRKPCCSDYRLR